MGHLHITPHASGRLAQRAIATSDVDLILEIGSEVEGGYMVCAKDFQEVEREVKLYLNRVRRLQGKRIVAREGRLITAYHPSRRDERRLLKSAERRNLCRHNH